MAGEERFGDSQVCCDIDSGFEMMDKSLRCVQRGASLVDLLVGMAVALVTVLAITQVMVASEAYKRTTTGGDDAQQNGAYSGLMLERYIRMGGSNFATISNAFGCPLNVYRSGALVMGTDAEGSNASSSYPEPFKTVIDFNLLLSPVIVKQGDAIDTIIVMSGQHPSIAKALSPTLIGSGSLSKVAFASKMGINEITDSASVTQHDLLLGVDQDRVAGSASCDIAEAVSIEDKEYTENGVKVIYSTVSLTGTGMKYTGASAFNSYTKSSLVADLGPSPHFLAFTVGSDGVSSDALLSYDMLANSMQSLSDGVVALKALYGVADSATNPVVSSWVKPEGDWAAGNLVADTILRMRALRLAVVARNSQREKTEVSPEKLTLFSDAASIEITVPDRYYRYKVFDLTIPLRQMTNMTRN
ncbi:PilW family protein [Niveibacterium terrae]|uniref:PilW family protein n=1 Tax=Niveibacterium terrae TaxID=3373598 RepID=UPI003A94EBA2